MDRERRGTARSLFTGVTALTLAAGALAISSGIGAAGNTCMGLDQAFRHNQAFLADQRAHPDALTDARIAGRRAVLDLIDRRRAAAGCATAPAAAPSAGAGPAGAGPAVTLRGVAGRP